MAKIITVFNQKGGCSKTTTTMHLGAALAKRGKRVLIADMDKQGSASRWCAQANEGDFPATVVNLFHMGGKMHQEVRKQLPNFDFVVIDSLPGADAPGAGSSLLISDLVVIPVIPSPLDLWATVASKQLALNAQIQNEGLQVRYLATQVPVNTQLSRDILEMIGADVDIPIMKSSLASRNAYRECCIAGKTVLDWPRDKAAANEIEGLTDEILSILFPEEVV